MSYLSLFHSNYEYGQAKAPQRYVRYIYIVCTVHLQFDYFSLYFSENLTSTRYYSKLF